jgi:hypothetical protein
MRASPQSREPPPTDKTGEPRPEDEPLPGPADDDPTAGVLDEHDDVSTRDRDVVEPGLSEIELGLLELGEVPDKDEPHPDEVGTPDGDEDDAAAEELDEDAGLVAGSEPAEVPGATDDLFPGEDDQAPVRDSGEEGLDEDLSDALDDSIRIGDAAWRQSGPPDEADDLGGEFAFPGFAVRDAPHDLARIVAVGPATGAECLARCGARIVVATREASGGVRLEGLHPPALRGPLGPPLSVDEEQQRVVSVAVIAGEAADSAPRAVHVATDRAMVFRWSPGADGWTVADSYVSAGGAATSWLALGVSRTPFRLIGSAVWPDRVWAWRPGGPWLRADGDGPWTLHAEGRALHALAEDPSRGSVLAFRADGEDAVLVTLDRDGSTTERVLPVDVADVLQAPGAAAAARGNVVWVSCLDPELPLLRGEAGGRRWTPVAGMRSVRHLVLASRSERLLLVSTSPADDADELRSITGAEAPRLVLRAAELGGGAGGTMATGPTRIESLAATEQDGLVAWVLSGGRLWSVELAARPADGRPA